MRRGASGFGQRHSNVLPQPLAFSPHASFWAEVEQGCPSTQGAVREQLGVSRVACVKETWQRGVRPGAEAAGSASSERTSAKRAAMSVTRTG